jgi:hypothetical protein
LRGSGMFSSSTPVSFTELLDQCSLSEHMLFSLFQGAWRRHS